MKSIGLFLLLVASIGLQAQQPRIATSILGTPQQIEFLPFADHLTMVFVHSNAAEIITLDLQYQPVSERVVTDLGLASGAHYLGISEDRAGWHLYFHSRGDLVATFVPRAGEASISRIEGYGNANFSGSFTFNGTMHLLRMSVWDNELRLVKFREGRQVFSETFPITTPDFVSRANGSFHKITGEPTELADSYHPAKWYRFGDRLVFTLDGEGVTEVVEIDLLSSVVHERRYDWVSPAAGSRGNSLCLGSYLAHCAWNERELEIELRDMRSQETMLAYHLDSHGGLQEVVAAKGWTTLRHEAIIDESGGIRQHVSDPALWFESLASREFAAVSFRPVEGGTWVLDAGGVRSEGQRGITGMVIEQRHHNTFVTLSLKLPSSDQNELEPLAFSSLRVGGIARSFRWQDQRVQMLRSHDGMLTFTLASP